eukprot:864271_1
MAHAKRLLCQHVRNAQSINEILPLLRLIPLEAIQHSISEIIRGLDTNSANALSSKCLSITNVLHDDMIQHILSFSDSLCMKYINKAFYSSYNKNRALELKQRQYIIDKHELKPVVKHIQTWIVHPTRTHLTSEEIANGYKGPLTGLKDLIRIQSGDRLLFCDGRYIESDEYEFDSIKNRDLQLIGIGDNVFLQTNNLQELKICNNLYFKNLKIKMDDTLEIYSTGSVSMQDCEITIGALDIVIRDGGTFNATNCVFDGNEPSEVYPIDIYDGANVNIVGCTFTNHERTCIWINGINWGRDNENISGISFKCIVNIFKNNFGYPVAMDKSASLNVKQALKHTVRHNILEGYNGVGRDDTVDAANKISRC